MPSSGTFNVKRLKSKMIYKSSGASKPKDINTVAKLNRNNHNEGGIKWAEQKKGEKKKWIGWTILVSDWGRNSKWVTRVWQNGN